MYRLIVLLVVLLWLSEHRIWPDMSRAAMIDILGYTYFTGTELVVPGARHFILWYCNSLAQLSSALMKR